MPLTPAEEAQIASYGGLLLPVGAANAPFAQTFDRRLVSDVAFQPTSGQLTITAIFLPAGRVVDGITFVSAATGETGGTHLWYALYKGDKAWNPSTFTLMAQSTDDTGATTFGTNTALRKALTAAQSCPYTGLYYLGFMCANSLGTQPALLNLKASSINANGGNSITAMGPITAGTADGSLAASAPATMGAITAIQQALYAYVD